MSEYRTIGIVVPNDFVKRLPFGGASGFIQNIMDNLGFRIVIFGAAANGGPLWEPQALSDNATFIGTYPLIFPSRFPLRLKALAGYLSNRRRILSSGVSLLYVHSPECALPFLFSGKRVPVVFHQHGSGNPVTTSKYIWARNGLLAWIFDRMHRSIYRRSAWIIAIDRLCSEQALHQGAADKVSLLMNAVDRGQFRPDAEKREALRRELGCGHDEFVLLFVGRLEEIKQVDRVIAALGVLQKDEGPRFRLFVAGDGTQRRVLERLAAESEPAVTVTFLGQVAHDLLPAFYTMADALVLPSKMEGVPMVILEALACGTPVVATAVGGIPDLVKTGANGVLLQNTNIGTIAGALRYASLKSWDRSTVAATVARWGAAEVGEELSTIFHRLIERKEKA